jgi:hypothetical protein
MLEDGSSSGLISRASRKAAREYRRRTTTPFASLGDRPLLVHCGHHKAGTLWFRKIFLAIAEPYGLRLRWGGLKAIDPKSDLAFYSSGQKFDPALAGDRPFRGSHMVRDPRDLVVSGYEYHLVTEESWAHRPEPSFGGLSYQAHLRALNEFDGLMAEIDWFARGTGLHLGAWDYEQSEFLELHYEDVLEDELGMFEKLFGWYDFNNDAREIGLRTVEQLSLKKGGAKPSHVRSGVPGEWSTRLTAEHVARFKQRTGDLVVRLGYEADPDW